MHKTNEQSAKYLNWNTERESCQMFGNILVLVVFASIYNKLVLNHIKQARWNYYKVSQITFAVFDFNKCLTIKKLSHVSSCSFGKYFPRFSYFGIISLD